MTDRAKQAKETGVINFTIGEEMGVRIMEIANEHLTHHNNPKQALKTITGSLIGMPDDLALQILKGDKVLFVEGQEIIMTERIPEIHDKIFPKVDIPYYLERNKRDIINHGENVLTGLYNLQKQMNSSFNKLTVDFSYNAIFKYVSGDKDELLDELHNTEDYYQVEFLIKVIKKYIEQTLIIKSNMRWMFDTWSEYAKDTTDFLMYNEVIEEISDMLMDVTQTLQKTLNGNFEIPVEDNSVGDYIDAVKEIDEVLSKDIEPVDIMDNYSAGWLSPEGLYYALNGEIANMLHQQISDALQGIGVIPDEEGINPDSWLEQQGWVKIHNNNINYGGCLNHKISKDIKNVNITKKQSDLIYNYIQVCHGSIVRCGWKMEKISAARFQGMAENNPVLLNKNYFSFD